MYSEKHSGEFDFDKNLNRFCQLKILIMTSIETHKFQQLICKSVQITKRAEKSAGLEKSETKDHHDMNPLR